ncbi:MAG: hypothetical protein ACTSRS_20235 [Candidatus Helarchaeota archaeon]
MELKVTKEYSEIVNLLDSLQSIIETEVAVMKEEVDQKYSLDITKEIFNYAADLIQMKISILLQDAKKDFEQFTILIDGTEVDLNVNEIEALMRRVARQIKDKLPAGADPDELQIQTKQYLRKLICKIPSRWTLPVIQQFLGKFNDSMTQLGVLVE